MRTFRSPRSLCLVPLLLSNLALGPATNARYQEAERLPSPGRLEADAAKQGNYLPQYLALVRQEKAYRASDYADYYLQTRAQVVSYLGDTQEASRLFDEAQGYNGGTVKPLECSPLEGYKPTDAESFLLKAADSHRVLMLNEGHHLPQTRVLTTRLLRGLYKKGFRYLALETFEPSAGDAETATRKYPTTTTGWYTNDPVMGDMVRQALEIGYTLVPYEFEGDSPESDTPMQRMNRREMEQARNLKTRVFDKDPNAKLLVHAGISHVSEKPQPIPEEKDSWVFMAIRFKELTGIDPLTVDQQTMVSHALPAAEPPVYSDAVRRGWVKNRAIVFTDKAGTPWTQPRDGMNVDAQVFLPPVTFKQDRPDWLVRDLQRVPVAVPPALQTGTGTRLVQAFFAGEPSNAVPADQVLLRPGAPAPTLMLPRRKNRQFTLRTWDETGKIVATGTVKL